MSMFSKAKNTSLIPAHASKCSLSMNGMDCNRYPKKPSPVSVTEVDGIEYKVEREVIRYERLEEVMDELPEFVQELLMANIES